MAALHPYHETYYAMYSSIYGGIVDDPRLMVVPLDDHLVHRGDGVFETFKCIDGNIYNMKAHLDRLCSSAQGLSIRLPCSRDELTEIVIQTVMLGDRRDCSIRVLLSRGPGSLGVNPYDCREPALYVVAYELKKPFMQLHPGGARAISSRLPVKPSPFANIKSVNYLFNVLMKKEAVDAGVDFVVAFDENGLMAEGPTENAGLVTTDRVLQIPHLERILAGTTMLRVMELSKSLWDTTTLKTAENADIPKARVFEALEMLVFGTTPDVAAIVEFDGRPIGDGKPGPVCHALGRLLMEDMTGNRDLLTPVF